MRSVTFSKLGRKSGKVGQERRNEFHPLSSVVETDLGENSSVIWGDSERLQQVVLNLLSNAIKFTPVGGRVTVRLSIVHGSSLMANSNQQLTINNEQSTTNRFAQIQVSDTGIGITSEFLPYVFDRFRQADSISARANKGLGLGGAIARHLVELHGGTIQKDDRSFEKKFCITMNKLSHNCIPSRQRICDRNLTKSKQGFSKLHGGVTWTQALWNNATTALLLLVALTACTITNSDSSNTGTKISEIANTPNTNLIGKTVTVNGEVEEVISPKAFIIEGDRFFNDPELLVLNLGGSPIVNDSNIQVTGTVRQFSKSEIEDEFDLKLTQKLEVEFRGKPVLVATAITLTPEPGEVAEEPAPFIGKNVTISGKVAKVIAPNAFTLDDKELIGGKELLVVGATSGINEGKTVRVRSSIRKFVAAEIEKDLDVKLQPGLKAKYQGRAAAIARSIEILE